MHDQITPMSTEEGQGKTLHQQSILHTLDEQEISGFHFKSVFIAGMGFFTDAYDLFNVAMISKLLGRLYYTEDFTAKKPGVLPIKINAAVNGVALCGTLAGQLFFGYLGDKFGRKSIYAVTATLMIISSICSAMSFGHTPKAVIGTLCFWRFWLGFGVGGDYPLSAVIASEYGSKKNRGMFVSAVFAMQGTGLLTAATMAIILSSIFIRGNNNPPKWKDDPEASCPPGADFVWRILLLFGCFPAMITMYSRVLMPETARYTLLVKKDTEKVAADMGHVLGQKVEGGNQRFGVKKQTFGEFVRMFWIPLLGCSMTWFLLDISYYSQNLFQKDVFTTAKWLPHAADMSCLDEVYHIARAQAIVALASTVPGYWFTVFTVEKLGRWKIQLMGFFFMTLFMGILAGKYDVLATNEHVGGFVTLYALCFFFSNWGPNATTFVIPSEIFPTQWRSTAHGICAACGKAGAIIGAFGFLYASQPTNPDKAAPYPPGIGLKHSLAILTAINGVGMLFTFLVPEPKGKSLEELSRETSDLALVPQ